jgi:plasmid stability protein
MAQVVVREIDDDTFAALNSRARRHGRSLEAEIRIVLAEAARHDDRKKVWAAIDRSMPGSSARGARLPTAHVSFAKIASGDDVRRRRQYGGQVVVPPSRIARRRCACAIPNMTCTPLSSSISNSAA